MDEMFKDIKRRRRRRRRPVWYGVVLSILVLILTVGIGIVLWQWISGVGIAEDPTEAEAYCVDIDLRGDAHITVEYGSPYEDPGVEAVGRGTVYDTQPIPIEVQTDGQVDPGKLGSYTVTYTAQYEGASASVTRTVDVVDTTPPVITLVTDPDRYTLPGQLYEEEGYDAFDLYDGDLTGRVVFSEKDGVVYYSVTDSSGNEGTAQRIVVYDDPTPPTLTLEGGAWMQITAGDTWQDPGYTAYDEVDGDLTADVMISGYVDRFVAGTYVLTYQVTDSYGNTASAERTVVVERVWAPDVVEPNGKVIYLTFDDGPWTDTDELLEILDKYDVKATFFVVNNPKFVHLLDDIAAAGHAIGLHSNTHKYSEIYANEEAFFEDLYAIQDLIYEHTGIRSTLMRFPGGSSNGVSAKYNVGIMTRLVKAVESLGFQYFDWNVDSNDAGGASTPDEVFRNVVDGVSKRDHSVVLMHDTRSFSVDAVERIIQWGLDNGYTFKALDATSPTCHHTWMKN